MACTVDFRALDEGFGGKTYKRKRQADEAAMDVDQPPSRKRRASEKPTYDGAKVSGRKWKDARSRRSSAMQASKKGKTLEQRTKEKEIKKAYRERMNELKDEIKQNKANKRKLREERDKRKQLNILRTGTKLQKITNPDTLKKNKKLIRLG